MPLTAGNLPEAIEAWRVTINEILDISSIAEHAAKELLEKQSNSLDDFSMAFDLQRRITRVEKKLDVAGASERAKPFDYLSYRAGRHEGRTNRVYSPIQRLMNRSA